MSEVKELDYCSDFAAWGQEEEKDVQDLNEV